MAKTQRLLEGWTFETVDSRISQNAPVRRSRRSMGLNDGNLVLRRVEDGLELKVGECIITSASGASEPQLSIIKELRFGIDEFIEITVMTFMRPSELAPETRESEKSGNGNGNGQVPYVENEVFITAIQQKVYVKEVIQKAHVISIEESESIVIDDSNKDTTFVCHRGCDETGAKISPETFDWREMMQLLEQDPVQFLLKIKTLTVEPSLKIVSKILLKQRAASSSPASTSTKKKAIPSATAVKKPAKIKSYVEPESEDEDFYESVSESSVQLSSESDSDLDDSEESEPVKPVSPVKRKKKAPAKPILKKKPKTAAAKPAPGTKRVGRPPKLPKLPKQDTSLSLPSLPKSTLKFVDDLGEEDVDINAPKLFKQLKKRLHASAKLQSLPCRENEFYDIYQSLEEAVDSEIGTCIYVSGTPGTGKTATVREVVKQLALQKASDLFDYIEINGLKLISPQAAYDVLFEKIKGKYTSNINAAVSLDSYFQTEDPKRRPLVVLMDELDQIVTKTQAVMYNFFNWPTYKNSKLIVIAVANTMDLPERMLTNKISSRLGLKRLQFPGYDHKQLAEIIKHRLEDLERLNAGKLLIKKDAVEFAARKVASVSGDARRALIICRRAIEIAEWEYFKKNEKLKKNADTVFTVEITHIMKAVNETTNTPISQFLESLSFLSKLFLTCLLTRKRKTGLAENTIGSVIDEMDNAITMQTSSYLIKNLQREKLDLNEMLYGSSGQGLRLKGFKFIIQELLESGILLEHHGEGERLGIVKLNIGDDEIRNAFRQDQNLQGIGGF